MLTNKKEYIKSNQSYKTFNTGPVNIVAKTPTPVIPEDELKRKANTKATALKFAWERPDLENLYSRFQPNK